MNIARKTILACAMMLVLIPTMAQEWQMQQVAMTTPWSETLHPDSVLQEYPRPQMERPEWLNLNGLWKLRRGVVGEEYSTDFSYDKKILVPFPIESALSGVMEKSDEQCYWYRRTITIPETMRGRNILLHFGAVDWETVVYVNGRKVGTHTGGYDPFYFDITEAITDDEQQEIAVYIYDNTGVQGQPTGKQSKNPAICWYTAVSGIWQTVWLEPVNPVHISSIQMEPNLDRSWLRLRVEASVTDGVTFDAEIKDRDGNVVASLYDATPSQLTTLTLSSVHPWSPDDPYLYDLYITLEKEGVATDSIKSYCGIRKIEVKSVDGTPRIFLNNEPIFQMGPLDQGYWPDGLYTAPSDEALLYDVRMTKELGFNMSRKHIKTEPSRWYYHCDREGLLVWQDMPSPNIVAGYEDVAKATFEDEAIRIVEALKNHPCIVHWVVFNEGWGQFDTERMTGIVDTKVNNLVPARFGKTSLICCASGWNDAEVGQIIDTHSYPAPSCPSSTTRAAVCGEYGGITLKIPGHIWPGGDFGYTAVESGADFTHYFNKLCDRIKELYYQGLNAAVYTQISDVEIEKNGILTYDRRILKPYSPYGELKGKIQECIALPRTEVLVKPILSTAGEHRYTWRYTTLDDAPRRWFAPEFDDSAWAQGEAAFGANMPEKSAHLVTTPWNTSQICMRRWFYLGDISQQHIDSLRFMVFHDDDVTLYINGLWAASRGGCVFDYVPLDISTEAKETLRPNSWNLIAIAGKQGSGQQIMDAGISAFVTTDFPYTESYEEYSPSQYSPLPTTTDVVTPKFKQLTTPVPAEPVQSAVGSVAAGSFYHTADRSNVAWGDYDNDGVLEVLYSGRNEHIATQGATWVYDYAGDDAFVRKTMPFEACYYACPVWFDYNNDGLLDLFLPGLKNYNYSTDLNDVAAYLYENKGADAVGNYQFEEVNVATKEGNSRGIAPIYNDTDGGRSRHWVSTGDYDRDGYIDIVVTGRDDYEVPEGDTSYIYHDRRAVYLYRNDSGRGFVRQETPLYGEKPFADLARGAVHFADMDNDGWLDIVASGYGVGEDNLHIYWNNGDGTFCEIGQQLFGVYDGACMVSDINGDGLNDILLSGYSRNKGTSVSKSLYIYENRGDRHFLMLDDDFCGFVEGVDGATPSVADVNHDGLPDILIGGHGAEHEITTWLYLNRGDFLFQSFGAYYDDPFGKVGSFSRISHGNNHLIDYNNDGYLDAWNMGWAQSSVCSNACATQLWKNVSDTTKIAPNTPPSVPTNLQCFYDRTSQTIRFMWEASTDDVTPVKSLRYNVYLRKKGADNYFMTVPADIKTGYIKVGTVSGEITGCTYAMSLPFEDADYEWGVQAIDNGKAGSRFALSTFNPATTSAVDKLDYRSEVYVADDKIHYDLSAPARLQLYDAKAILHTSIVVEGQGSLTDTSKGLYIIRLISGDNISTYKVVL
ncbi:MAG: VCBS repeat-containing protein [Coprobacter sp.]|nr:VCBS repeat-containing protein [Coprobacter sp.]